MAKADDIKAKAIEAASASQVMAERLLMAASPKADPEQIMASLSLGYQCWPMLCRRMAELEELAPRSAESGFTHDEQLMRRIATRKASIESQLA